MKTLIIGLGPHGKRVLSAVQNSTLLEVGGLVDLSAEVLSGLEQPENLKFTNLDKALQATTYDLACITTTAPVHAALAIKCMDNGIKNIMVEKPLACSLGESKEMLKAAERNNARLAVDHPRRFSKNYRLVKGIIDAGELGQFKSVYIQRPGIGLGCLATHSFDLANFLSGLRPLKITAWVDEPLTRNPRGDQFVDPGGTVILDYGEGRKGLISQLEDGAGPMFVEVNFTEGRVHLDEKNDFLEIIKRDLSVVKKPNQGAVYERIINPDNIGGKRSLVGEIQELLEDLVSNEQPMSTGEHGYDAMEILMAAYLSHENGNMPIPLPLSSKHDAKWLPVT